ncbi:WW and C2 domain containing protein kibra isoform X1 [Rhynchophorus ferrugineus]|uniref:WW and C2 domain containing protein kibra isoform X1 n=1 Tax=Rhynchophorus ferrugineus TaxID=354439 RepID=UPI003FCEDB9F
MLSAPDSLECTRKLEWPGPEEQEEEEEVEDEKGGEGGGRPGPCRRTNQGRPSGASVEMEMWPLCYVHTAPAAVFRVHSLPLTAVSPEMHTLPAYPVSRARVQTLPASYVVGNAHYGVRMDIRGPKRPAVAAIEMIAKKDIYQVKSQRLILAQDEYNHLNNALTNLTTSRTSLCSTGSVVSTKYDPDLLKSDVAMAKNRVSRLRSELEQIRNEMNFTQRGVETLASVEQKLNVGQGMCYNIAEAQAIMAELRNIQKSLSSGEKEKAELMQSLAKLKDDLTRLQLSESSPDVSTLSLPQEKLSTASQTDLSCESVPIGTRLAEMAKMRLEYDEARKKVQHIQQQLADLEEKVQPGQVESDKDRLLLFQEKEQLLRELRSITPRMRSKEEMCDIQQKCRKLEQDLKYAREMSNRAIADRLRLHEEKQLLLQRLKDGLKQMTQLESQLKTLSASTLSVSSSSSLGSLSTTSSKGSLSSGLSFTDIYGGPQCVGAPNVDKPIDMADLHRRVERLLKNDNPVQSPVRSQPSLSPRSSLSSVSPPVSPMYENLPCLQPPPTYEQVEKDRKLQSEQRMEDRLFEIINSTNTNEYINYTPPRMSVPSLAPLTDLLEAQATNMSQGSGLGRPSRYSYESSGDAPLSPISETPPPIIDQDEMLQGVALSRTSSSGTNTRSVSAAVSDESVAGDSGVFEASNRKPVSTLLGSNVDSDTAQVQIKLRYVLSEGVLSVTVEKARNLNALFIDDNSQVYIKTALLPANPPQTCCTKPVRDLKKANFGDTFNIPIVTNKILTKTLQVNVWSKLEKQQDVCVGCTQISLADFNIHSTTQKWYNILCIQEETRSNTVSTIRQNVDASTRDKPDEASYKQMGKEESSDDSTIISSQTSTLTRNQETIIPSVTNLNFQELYNCLKSTAEYDSADDSDEEDDVDDEVAALDFRPNDKLDVVHEHCDDEDKYSDKQTNTECAFYPEQAKHMKLVAQGGNLEDRGAIKRSQTFSPSAQVSKHDYICKLNRSDSDSAMPLYRRGSKPFERHAIERRSLRYRKSSMGQLTTSKSHTHIPQTPRTSIDLELDLQAQHTRLDMLNMELLRLRELKQRLEVAKEQGDSELATYLLENQQFQNLMAQAEKTTKTPEEKKVEKMLRKVSKEIYKLRKTKAGNGKPDVISFKEKMAFFTRTQTNVPFLPEEGSNENNINQDELQQRTNNERNESNDSAEDNEEDSPYRYIVDRTLGVEV